MKYFVNRVQFEDLETVLKIYKKQGLSMTEVLSFFSQEENRKKVKATFSKTKAILLKDALSFANTEQRMVAMRTFEVKEIMGDLNAVCVDKQTVTKNQTRWNAQGKPYQKVYNDTYALYKIDGTTIGLNKNSWGQRDDIYFVKCKCTSTTKDFYLYVSAEVGKKSDAIEAIAWTMRFRGKPLSKQQYMDYMYSET